LMDRTFGLSPDGQGKFDRLPDLALELVRLKVDVIVAFVTAASLAAMKANTTIPVVMVGVADPIGAGLVASLSHPGGNITGNSSIAADIVGKQLEMLKEIDPKISRVAVLWNPANSVFQTLQLRQAETSARTSICRHSTSGSTDTRRFRKCLRGD
jgi:putative tryptophan/tyrosine transport system substrate-binding protein